MHEILLLTTLSCSDAGVLMQKIRADENLDRNIKIELVQTLRHSVPECQWDAND